MVARQVAADGVRTTWGEHIPGGEPMTDSPILTSEDITFFRSTGQWNNKHRQALLDSHEALRAERDRWENAAADCAEERRELRAALAAAEAERDQAIRERDYQYKLRSAMTDRALTAEAKIHTLRDELAWVRDELRQPKYSGCGHITYRIAAALGEKNDGT